MIDVETVGRVVVMTINRPDARNAVNGLVAEGIEAAIDRLENEQDLRVGVLTGAPPVFCAGADLKELSAGNRTKLSTERGGFAGLVKRVRQKPLIAAVDGAALAGGAEIVLACDLVVASLGAQFGFPEVKRGLVAAAGGMFRLPRRLPLNVAMQALLTGDPIDAETAWRFGLVSELVEPGQALRVALALAQRISEGAPLAVQASREIALTAIADEGSGWLLSGEASSRMLKSEDVKEGIQAFFEKRAPVWRGR